MSGLNKSKTGSIVKATVISFSTYAYSADFGGGGGHAGEQLGGGDRDDTASKGRYDAGESAAFGGRGRLVPDEVPGVRHRQEDRQGAQDAHQAHAPQNRKVGSSIQTD